MMRSARRLTRIWSTVSISAALVAGCVPEAPLVTSVNTLCVSTSRYHVTAAQKAAFLADEATWGGLVRWLAGFNKVRDGECLQPASAG